MPAFNKFVLIKTMRNFLFEKRKRIKKKKISNNILCAACMESPRSRNVAKISNFSSLFQYKFFFIAAAEAKTERKSMRQKYKKKNFTSFHICVALRLCIAPNFIFNSTQHTRSKSSFSQFFTH